MTPITFPFWPLVATLATQTLATLAAYTLPALAPMVAAVSDSYALAYGAVSALATLAACVLAPGPRRP